MLILVIDDDELSRELLTLLLEVEGYRVVSVTSGADGLEQLSRGVRPDAVLTDMQMPGISGTELAMALRAALPVGVPVLAMSGSDSRPEDAANGTPSGFDGFLLKPFSASDLSEALAKVNRETGARASVADATKGSLQLGSDEGEVPALDEEIFRKMQELMPKEQLGQMFALCIADARSRLSTMRGCAEAGDDKGYRTAAHAIKGGAGMIGAAELHTLAGTAEGEGLVFAGAGAAQEVGPGTSGVTGLIDQLSRACERLERILVERLRT